MLYVICFVYVLLVAHLCRERHLLFSKQNSLLDDIINKLKNNKMKALVKICLRFQRFYVPVYEKQARSTQIRSEKLIICLTELRKHFAANMICAEWLSC